MNPVTEFVSDDGKLTPGLFSQWLLAVSKTHYIEYRDDGFWAYDVAQGVLLKYLADFGETRAEQPGMSWLKEAAHTWRIGAVLYGLRIDESWSVEQLELFKNLVHEACELLQTRETISSAEIEAWPMIDDLRIFTRGAKEVSAVPVVELGKAIVSLLEGSLPTPPAGTWWCFGCPGGRTTIRKRDSMKVEGHWRQSHADDDSGLPFPIAEKIPWKGQGSFLAALAKKENEAEGLHYRGLSKCRICGERNGSVEFELDGWRWPEGLRHYVEMHNVRPTKEFIEFVLLDKN